MYYKVKIKKMPKARTGYQVRGSLFNDVPAFGGADYNSYIGTPNLKESKYITGVPRDKANLEAEGGETVFGDINGDGFPEHKIIKGPRHSQGGVPLNLPDDSFIYSDTKSMKIKDPNILAMFNKPMKKSGYTPAELAKSYDLEKYRKILQDPNSDHIDRKTAELMLRNYNVKLAQLALAQEAKKGFPQGIPKVAEPAMQAMGLKEDQVLPMDFSKIKQGSQEMPEESPEFQQEEPQGQEMAEEMNEGQPVAMPMAEEQMQSEEEQMVAYGGVPMAAYGMSMGGYDMPFYNMPMAQDGLNFTVTDAQGNEVRPAENYIAPQPPTKPDLENYDSMDPIDKFNIIHRMKTTPQMFTPEELERYSVSDEMPLDLLERINAESSLEPTQILPEQAYGGSSMAMYGMEMGGYDMPFDLPQAEYGMPMGVNSRNYMGREPMYARGGISYDDAFELYKMDGGGKVYKESDLPEGTIVKSSKDPSIKVGDYVKDADGNIRKIKSGSLKQTVTSETKPGTRSDFINASSENKTIMDKGDAIIKRAISEGKAVDLGGGKVRLKGNLDLTFEDRIALSRALNASGEFGTGKYVIDKQSMTTGYSKLKDGAYKGSGSFVAGFTPEDYEKRYLFERAKGLGNTDEEAFQIIKDTYADPAKQAKLRKEYMSALGKGSLTEGKTDAELLNPKFYKDNYAAVTEGVETTLGAAGYRPKIGNEQLSGFEHFDAAGYKPDWTYDQDEPCKCEDGTTPPRDEKGECPCKEKITLDIPEKEKGCECTKADGTTIPSYIDETTGECSDEPCKDPKRPTDIPAPWWLQDTIKTTAIAGDLMGLKKYMPWAPDPSLVKPRPVFLDPTRELAQQSEQANIQTQAMAQFAGPQALSARSSSVQGQAAKQAADTLSRYNNANVNIANQFEMKRTDIDNQETLMKQAAKQKLYDQNTIANQQFDNSKRAMRNALVNQYTNAITNRWQTHALNQMYPQFNVDPSVGGRGFYTGNDKKITPGSGGTSWQDAYNNCKKNNPGMSDELLKECAKNTQSSGGSTNTDIAAYNAHYGKRKKKGGASNHPGFLYGDVTYPFIL